MECLFSRLQESYESIETSLVQVDDAEESNRLTEERYHAGASTITDLLDAQTSLARAEAAKVDAVWGYQAAKTIFLWTQGVLSKNIEIEKYGRLVYHLSHYQTIRRT